MDLETVKIKVILDGKEAEVGLRKFNKLVDKMDGGSKKLNKSSAALGKTFQKAGLIGKALGIGAVGLTMKSFAENAKKSAIEMYKLSLLSEKTGVSVKNLAKYGSALRSLGADEGNFGSVISRISGGVAGVRLGDPRMMSVLASMGINSFQNGKMRSGEAIFRDIADWAKREKDRGTDERVIAEFLSREFGMSQDIINKLWDGAAGWDRMIEEQNKKTGVLTKSEIEDYKELQRRISETGETMKIAGQKVGTLFIPAIESVLKTTQFAAKFTSDAIDNARDIIKSAADVAAGGGSGGNDLRAIYQNPHKFTKEQIQFVLKKHGMRDISDILLGQREITYQNAQKWLSSKSLFGYDDYYDDLNTYKNESSHPRLEKFRKAYTSWGEQQRREFYKSRGIDLDATQTSAPKIEKLFKDPEPIVFPVLDANWSLGGGSGDTKVDTKIYFYGPVNNSEEVGTAVENGVNRSIGSQNLI